MKVVSLKENPQYVSAYVDLRNKYKDLLATSIVTVQQTKAWLKTFDGEVLCLIENGNVVGAGLLHLHRNGELTIFTSSHGLGYGSVLLKRLETSALKRGLAKVWAWTLSDNKNAQRFFEHNMYVTLDAQQKQYKHLSNSCIYVKQLK